MPDQPTLFDEEQKPDPTREEGFKYDQTAPDAPADSEENPDDVDTEAVAAAVLSALEEDGERDTVRAQYARLLWRAGTKGVTLQADSGEYVTVDALTDKEAAQVLGREKTTICARRNELMGDRPEYESCPVVVETDARESHVRPTGHENTTYRINERLVEAADQE